jgi:CRP/FNR family transcriptional regulator, cyclic AMP receptor protein
MTRARESSYSVRVISSPSRWFGWTRDPEHAHRMAILSRTPVFAGLPRRLLGRLAGKFFEKSYAPGEVIFHEGDPGKCLFVVLEGEIEILQQTNEGERRIVFFGPSTAFGELALIDDLPRSATARASVPSRLLILYRSHFEALVGGDRGIAFVVMQNLLRMLAGYVRAANRASAGRSEAPAPASPTGGGVPAAPTNP